MIYLASPFSHLDPAVMKSRHEQALNFTYSYIANGYPMFSPIVYGFPFFSRGLVGSDYLSWKRFNDQMIHDCEAVWVLQLDGWQESKGVAYEISYATDMQKPVSYVEPL